MLLRELEVALEEQVHMESHGSYTKVTAGLLCFRVLHSGSPPPSVLPTSCLNWIQPSQMANKVTPISLLPKLLGVQREWWVKEDLSPQTSVSTFKQGFLVQGLSLYCSLLS